MLPVCPVEGATRRLSVFMLQMRGLDPRSALCSARRPRGPELVFFSASHPVITITVKCATTNVISAIMMPSVYTSRASPINLSLDANASHVTIVKQNKSVMN